LHLILSLIPQGGSVLDLPEWLRPKGYFHNTYARLVNDRPAPTITRNFGTPSSSRCIHPTQNRALSTREGARLQGFPDSYQFIGSKCSKNLQIGNAVPPLLAEVVAKQIISSLKKTS
jgi:DNA (cytosine-5)-methyltransferase 1